MMDTTTTTPTLQTRLLAALAKCCEPKNSRRTGLKGLHFDGDKVSASNGKVLVAVDCPMILPERHRGRKPGATFNVADALRTFKPTSHLTLAFDADGNLMLSDGDNGSRVVPPIDAPWPGVFTPDDRSLDPIAAYSPKYLAQVLAVFNLLPPSTNTSDGYVRTRAHGSAAPLVLETAGKYPAGFGLIMPVDD